MSERISKKRKSYEITNDEPPHKRVLSQCMSHDFTLIESDKQNIDEYIQYLRSSDSIQLFNEFILKSRLNRILTCRPSRNNSKSVEKLWYTTTCYLSCKIIILFFTMLRLFSIDVGVLDKSQLTILWLNIEKMMWEILTTNSLDYRSDPPSLLMIGQGTDKTLREFISSIPGIDSTILDSLEYIASISRGSLKTSVIVTDMVTISSSNSSSIEVIDCEFINNKIPMIAGISISTSIDRPPTGIIHWFSFVIDKKKNTIDIYSSWADGDRNIQSVMTNIEVDIFEFNILINIFKNGSNDEREINEAISYIAKYFFSNPPIVSENITNYLRSVFIDDDAIIAGKFNIIIFPEYYNHCIKISNLLLNMSLNSRTIRSEMESVVKISKKLYFDTNLIKLKLLLIFLYTKSGCSNSEFYLKGDFGVRGGKQKKRRKTNKRKTIKRKRRYTHRHKK